MIFFKYLINTYNTKKQKKCKKGNYNCHHKLITHYNALIATL